MVVWGIEVIRPNPNHRTNVVRECTVHLLATTGRCTYWPGRCSTMSLAMGHVLPDSHDRDNLEFSISLIEIITMCPQSSNDPPSRKLQHSHEQRTICKKISIDRVILIKMSILRAERGHEAQASKQAFLASKTASRLPKP